MGKSRKDRYGNNREQRLQYENEKLKKTISQLRKQIARIDIDRSSDIKEIVNKHYQQEEAEKYAEKERESLEELKRAWQCSKCGTGFLEIILLNKMNDLCYYRKCNECQNRTKLQKYNKNVRGIIKK
jgi:hypothetical protein